MHHHEPRLARRDDACHGGIALQSPLIVDDRRAGLQRQPRDGGLGRVDGDRDVDGLDQGGERRGEAGDFLGLRDRRMAGPGRFRAHVDNGGACLDMGTGLGNGCFGLDEVPAVGEGIRGDVDDAHDGWPGAGHVEKVVALGCRLRLHGVCPAGLTRFERSRRTTIPTEPWITSSFSTLIATAVSWG